MAFSLVFIEIKTQKRKSIEENSLAKNVFCLLVTCISSIAADFDAAGRFLTEDPAGGGGRAGRGRRTTGVTRGQGA